MSNLNFAYLGTSELSVKILDKLIENGYVPSLVVTAPDKTKKNPPGGGFGGKPPAWGVNPPSRSTYSSSLLTAKLSRSQFWTFQNSGRSMSTCHCCRNSEAHRPSSLSS